MPINRALAGQIAASSPIGRVKIPKRAAANMTTAIHRPPSQDSARRALRNNPIIIARTWLILAPLFNYRSVHIIGIHIGLLTSSNFEMSQHLLVANQAQALGKINLGTKFGSSYNRSDECKCNLFARKHNSVKKLFLVLFNQPSMKYFS
jgi:hypothetical protein